MVRQFTRDGNRKLIRAANALVLVITALTFVATPSQATTAAGRTAGTFAVSPTGAATYTIPIWAPPGPQGLQPHIALTYNSQQGNGYVGVGWTISGLSSIYRCNLTFAQDAAPAPVALATSDGYCMDGQRLRLTGGTYGAAGSTYQTEVANFINVTAYGAAGNGPAYWIARDRNGRTYMYDFQVLANGSSTVVSWMLNEVSDPAGNTLTIAYSTATGTAVPTTISWTPSSHGSTTYNYTMTFAYGANVVPPYGYVGGTSFTNPNLLSSIAVAYSGTAVKTYYLTYQASSTTGRDLLTQVQECAGTGTGNCLLPTTLSYQAGAAGVGSGTAVSGGLVNVGSTAFAFKGDGINDLTGTNSAGALLVAFGSATGYGTPVPAPSGAAAFGDIDGSGVDGILANTGGTWYYYKWNGSAFAGTSTGISAATAATPLLADLNGDGRADFVYTDSSGIVHVRLSTSTPGTVSFSSDINTGVGIAGFTIFAQTRSSRALHFWGNSQADLIGVEKTCKQYSTKGICIAYQYIYNALHFTGSTFSTAGLLPAPVSSPISIVDFADYNDDGCTDVLTATELLLSACNGTATIPVALPSGVTAVGGMDWNGDGRRDVLVKQANGNLGVVLSTGSGLSSSVIGTSDPAASTSYTAAPNLTGDGQDGLIGWDGTSATYYLHNSAGAPPDLLTSVTDGYGNNYSPNYVAMTVGGNCYHRDATPPPYPSGDYHAPIYLTCSYTATDGAGGTYTVGNGYYNSDADLQGRGWEGFERDYSQDSRTNIVHMVRYSTQFPSTGVITEVLDRQSDWSTYIRDVTNTPASLSQETLSSTPYQQRYFPWFTQSQVQMYEFGGTKNGQLITTSTTSYGTPDSYGNFPTISVATQDNDTTSPYYGAIWTTATTNTLDVDTAHWCLNLYTEIQVAYSDGTPADAVTRTKTFTPDTTNCRYTAIVTEPSSSQFKVTETLGYDSFGNVNSDTMTGVGMTGRLTSTNWGTTGQFPMSVTDPANAQTQFNYNFSYGLKSSVTDPNNLTTSWAYNDGFGRVTQETRPDGTYTVYSYYNCAGTSGCLVGTNGLRVEYDVYGTNAGLITYSEKDYDSLNRQLMTQTVMLSGSISRTDVRYDALGRVSQSSFPCVYSNFTTACSYWTTNSYDVLNRLYQSRRPISSNNSTLQTTTYAYAGRTTTVTDPQSNARTMIADVNGWLRQTKDPLGYSVTLAYDSAGSKTKVTDSSGNTLWSGTYNYGLAAYLASATDMDMGSWGFTFDALGEKTAWSDAKSQSFAETYDALSRPLTRTEPDLFTQWTWGSSASSHNIGKLQSECTGAGTSCTSSGYSESETYDSLGRRSQRSITISGYSAFTYAWGYNATTGLLSTLTYPTSTSGYALQLQYAYANGVLQSVADISDSPNVTVWTANTMDPAGHVTQETLGNGIVTNRSFDAVTQWLGTAQSGVGGGAAVKNLGFLYDEMGNVTQRQDNNLGLTENIYYDNDYRFSYSKLNGTQNLAVWIDVAGNITARSDVAGGASWTYDPVHKHEVTQAGSSSYQYSYDANGNAKTRQGSTISWASYNYPTTINAGSGSTAETVAFSYGPDRQRWQQMYTGNGTQETTNYIGGLLEVVASGSATDYRHYISVPGEQIAVYSRKTSGTNTFSYLLSDQEASVASITNNSGAQVVAESFDAFGSRRNPATWSGAASNSDLTTIAGTTREGYTFQTALGLWMGMNHMNGRVEDSVTGRMLSADPTIPHGTDPQSYNRYSYARNNPHTFADPTGFDDKQCGKEGCAGDIPYSLRAFNSCYGENCGGGWGNSVITTVANPDYLAALNYLAAAVNNLVASVSDDTLSNLINPTGSNSAAGSGSSSYSLLPYSAARGSGSSTVYNYDDGAQLIASDGSLSWRNNNPGNLNYTQFSVKNGAIGSYTNSNGTYAIFPDEATGDSALQSLLQSGSYQALSLNQAIARFAPPSQNDTGAYQSSIASSMGISGSTPLSSLSSQQVATLMNYIQAYEQWTPGSLTYIFPTGQGPGQWH